MIFLIKLRILFLIMKGDSDCMKNMKMRIIVNMEMRIIDDFKSKINAKIKEIDLILESLIDDFDETVYAEFVGDKRTLEIILDMLNDSIRKNMTN